MTSFSTADVPDIPDKRVIVTGANSGIGRAAAQALAAAGAQVTLAVRDLEKGRSAAAAIAGKTEVRGSTSRACPPYVSSPPAGTVRSTC